MSDLKESIDRDGYVLIKNVLSRERIEHARAAVIRMWEKVMSGQHGFFQIDTDVLRLNITGIDQIFHPAIFEEDILAAAVESNVLAYASQILGIPEPAMLLNRIHMNDRYRLNGTWHRDAEAGDLSSVQAAIYLYPESGLHVIPGSHTGKWCDIVDAIIDGNAGDMILFYSALHHRGTCENKRAHIFFRIGEDRRKKSAPGGEWGKLLNDPARNCDYFQPTSPSRRQSFWRRGFNELCHFLHVRQG